MEILKEVEQVVPEALEEEVAAEEAKIATVEEDKGQSAHSETKVAENENNSVSV